MSESRKSRLTFTILATVVRPAMNLMLGRSWDGTENLPKGGGFIACPNHVTEIDPLVVGHFFYNQGILPRYLAKASLFKVPVLGPALRATQQVPVQRGGAGAAASLDGAQQVIDAGGALIVYPEGTLTRDPGLWPMKGRTGAARLALQTGAPVIPIAHWGAQDLLPRYGKMLHLFPRKRVRLLVGKPVDLSDLRGVPLTKSVLEEATERIMAELTTLVASLRGETAPTERWDPSRKGQKAVGRGYDPQEEKKK
ncbi:lysophospholipid acyltransferase family protein [Arthrobacter citreus]|uniref:lysophospholipid acyltransferase family protein n=1 Tax=Arthrobacter citreus TaxID=1670 RepID=UPI0036D9C2C8